MNIHDLVRRIAQQQLEDRAAWERMDPETKARLRPGAKALRVWHQDEDTYLLFAELITSPYPEDEALTRETPWRKLVRGYSVLCPEGEIGTWACCDCVPISDALFEAAKAKGWHLDWAQLERMEEDCVGPA